MSVRTTVGPYSIRGVLGQGAMGVVYAAEDERLERTIAIKTLGQSKDPVSRGRLLREARAAAGLNHPGICQVFDVGEEEGELWVAMELLEGESLLERLERGRPRTREAIEIGLGILAPLAYLHERGLVHRDLKPSNIFVTPHGVKLLDFSLTVEHVGESDTRLTQEGSIVGTPHYMAPEQWRGQHTAPPTDLFACGAIVYEMFAGEWAFPGDDPIDVFHACVFEEPPPLSGPPGIEEIDGFVRKALKKEPADRYQSAQEMSTALAEAHERFRSAASTTGTGTFLEVADTGQIRRFIALPFQIVRSNPEIEFLASSLPEAIGASLSGLEHIVVRSTGLAATNGQEVDLKKLATELEVDYALRGTLLAAGSRVRLNAQLVEVPEGTVVWTIQEEAEIGDLFELQDELTHRVVEGLHVPLSDREELQLEQDAPANARAYELYLRALHARSEGFTTTANLTVRDLLRSALDADPNFAPAWARYARVCRVISKYGLGDTQEHLKIAEDAFERARALNPESPVFHNFYTYYELEDRGEPIKALLRLLGRIRERVADAHLYAGLVAACRFCGLYEASLAADRRGRRLDPNLGTSVHHTYFQLGRLEEVEAYDLLHALQGDDEQALEILRREAPTTEGTVRTYIDALRAALEGRAEDCEAAYRKALETGLRDPEHSFYFARALSKVGAGAAALEAIERVVDRGFYCSVPLAKDPWLEAVRDEADFATIRGRAEEGRRRAVEAYREAGGERLLGVAET